MASSSPMNSNDRSHVSQDSGIGKAFGSARTSWNSNIWRNKASLVGGSFTDSPVDGGRAQVDQNGRGASTETMIEGKTGSGSLLPSSESDGWVGRNLPWEVTNATSQPLAVGRGKSANGASTHGRGNDQSTPAVLNGTSGGAASPYFAIARASGLGHTTSASTHGALLSQAENLSAAANPEATGIARLSGYRVDDSSRRHINNTGFRNNQVTGSRLSHNIGFNTVDRDVQAFTDGLGALNLHSLPRGNSDQVQKTPQQSFSRLGHNNSVSALPQRPTHSSHPSFHSDSQKNDNRYAAGQHEFGGKLLSQDDRYALHAQTGFQRPACYSHVSFDAAFAPYSKYTLTSDEGSPGSIGAYTPDGTPDAPMPNTSNFPRFGDRGPASPASSDYRGNMTSYYSAGGTPGPSNQYRTSSGSRLSGQLHDSELLDRKLRGVLQQQDYFPPGTGQVHARVNLPQFGYTNYPLSVNHISNCYPPVTPLPPAQVIQPRAVQQRDHDIMRSPLLEEFKAHQNKSSIKRYELRDLYHHIVEFSGDQDGSRFIQQKLETANSDEKDQVFSEIQPNALQLMQDVFGNYVVQKIFEHGNQTQKKILAKQMRGHIQSLSLQMYGCRVVQKALEHILADQQVSMVKELESCVVKCVRDQNGNHVIQKAIERVPTRHIQFIIDAFKGGIGRLATHAYGCRVVQRMLEYCEEPDRQSILNEVHACTPNLIIDQFGNYVVQHILRFGDERDRSKVIQVVGTSLVRFSKHKFASNVVESSLEYADPSQRADIVRQLTTSGSDGENPLEGLVRDQYGNYVIQKVLSLVKGEEWDSIAQQLIPRLEQLKKPNCARQIGAIEKIFIDEGAIPAAPGSDVPQPESSDHAQPLSPNEGNQSPRSSLPSTAGSVMEGTTDGRKNGADSSIATTPMSEVHIDAPVSMNGPESPECCPMPNRR
ncbi:hypothetical protein AJ80_04887 [Polytolypa hystricis UAMH7299]|uniref:Pumilio homology domain family member 3 n=1 Tax=Polytolypa hystricis (strain UAMH7299) TaxID=1447883 RepID=A0A2B7Y7N5_POLH7|nr:hypothetical protein AJ80_04887 [Polytolypa hystricis UAMH7299]